MIMQQPKMLIIEPTNRCNLRCLDCPSASNDGKYPLGDMNLEFFKAIVNKATEEFPETVIVPWGYGEPLLTPNYVEMLAYLRAKGRKYYVTTNGTVWSPEVFNEIFGDGSTAYQLIISIDGLYGSGTIAKARPGTDEGKLCANIARIFEMKEARGSSVDVAVKICERGQDYEEVENFVHGWLKGGKADYVCVGKILKGQNETVMRAYPCQYFDHNFMFIRYDGNLAPCTYNEDVLNNGALRYGTIKPGDSLLEAYNNPTIQALRDDQHKGIFHSPCDKCPIAYCGMGIRGEIEFRKEPGVKYFYQKDYYNSIFSRVKKWKDAEYYK